MHAIVEESVSESRRSVPVPAVTIVGLEVVDVDFATLELVVENDVHDTADGAGAVRCRSATRHRVDALHQHLRDEVQIETITLVSLYRATGIDQGQSAAAEKRVQAAQIGNIGAGKERGVSRIGGSEVRDVGRRHRHGRADVHDTQVIHRRAVDHGGGRRGGEIRCALDASARNGDLFQLRSNGSAACCGSLTLCLRRDHDAGDEGGGPQNRGHCRANPVALIE